MNTRPNDVPLDAESDGHISICCALSSAPRLAPEHGTLSRHPSFCTHCLFKAMGRSSPGRLPSARSSAFHRGGTRAIPFYRSHAFASRPLSLEPSCYPPVTESGPPSRAIPPSSTAVAASERRKGHASLISTNPPPDRAPLWIGGFSSATSVLFSAACRTFCRLGCGPVRQSSSRNVLDGALRALGDVLLRAPLLFSRSGTGLAADRGYPFVVSTSCTGLCGELSLASLGDPSTACQSRPGRCRTWRCTTADIPSDTPCRPAFAFRLEPRQSRLPLPSRQRQMGSTAQSASIDECASPSWSLARPRVRIRPPPLCGFAAAHRLPTLSSRRGPPLSRWSAADARLRSSGGGCPFHSSLRPFDLETRRGAERCSSTSAILLRPIRGTTLESPESPPARYRVPMPFHAGRFESGLRLAFARLQLAGRPKPSHEHQTRSPGCYHPNQGLASLSLASGTRSDRPLSRLVVPKPMATPVRDVRMHLLSQNT